MNKCLHCKTKHGDQPRGLCRICYYVPGVRHQYPVTKSSNRRGVGHQAPKRQATPTTAQPGTPEKMEELARRARNGEELWHSGDAR